MRNIQILMGEEVVCPTWEIGGAVMGVPLSGTVCLDDESLSASPPSGHRFYTKFSPAIGEKVQELLCASVEASLRLVDGGPDAPADAVVEIRANTRPSIDVSFIFPPGTYGSIGGSEIKQGSLLCITAHDGVVMLAVERGGSGDWMLSWALSRTESARVVESLIAGFGEAVRFLRGVEAEM